VPELDLLVLRCADLGASKVFYEALGLVLTREQHGNGPVHYSTLLGSTVLELYPTRADTVSKGDSVRLGLTVQDVAAAVARLEQAGFAVRSDRQPVTVLNPDGRTCALTQER
jgi:hypothetical protein